MLTLPSVIPVSEINYLCVHKKLRSKRLAPVLIKEVTRQCNLKGIFQAIYTAGVVIPTPVSVCRYYHRSLNIPKLIETGFSFVPRHMTLARMILVNKLQERTSLKGLREMEEKDLDQVNDLFRRYMQRFDLSPIMDVEEIKHNFLSGKGRGKIGGGGKGRREGQVTWSYVVEVDHILWLKEPVLRRASTGPQNAQDHRLFLILFPPVDDHQQPEVLSTRCSLSLLLCDRNCIPTRCGDQRPAEGPSQGPHWRCLDHCRPGFIRRLQCSHPYG